MERTTRIASTLSLIGAFLIFINTLWIAMNGSPLVFYSYQVSSVEDLTTPGAPLWARLTLGFQGIVEGPLSILWLIISVINLYFAISFYLRPERPEKPSSFTLLFSLLSIFVGGGFIIGFALALIGSVMGLQSRLPVGETFFVKLLRSAKLDSKLFTEVIKQKNVMREAAFTVLFINFLSGLGCNLYTLNVDKIIHSSDTSFRILLLGQISYDASVISNSIINMGLGILKWLLLTLIIYLVGTKLMGNPSEFDEVARAVAFTYAPICFQLFIPLIFTNQPFLTLQYPMTIYFVTNIWMISALIVAVKHLFDLPTRETIGTVSLAGTIYWLTVYKIVFPMFNVVDPTFKVPGVMFNIQPLSLVLILVTLSIIISFLCGTFTKR